jgi:shikimate kinase
MAAGKSTVGRILARRLGREFVDLDERVVERTGRTAADIIRGEGEA